MNSTHRKKRYISRAILLEDPECRLVGRIQWLSIFRALWRSVTGSKAGPITFIAKCCGITDDSVGTHKKTYDEYGSATSLIFLHKDFTDIEREVIPSNTQASAERQNVAGVQTGLNSHRFYEYRRSTWTKTTPSRNCLGERRVRLLRMDRVIQIQKIMDMKSDHFMSFKSTMRTYWDN